MIRCVLLAILALASTTTAPPTAQAQGTPASSGTAATRSPASLAPTDGAWTKVRFMRLGTPHPDDKWIADQIGRSGLRPAPGTDAAGMPVTFQVFELIPNSRTIVAIGNSDGCFTLPQTAPGPDARTASIAKPPPSRPGAPPTTPATAPHPAMPPAPSPCTVATITVYTADQINARLNRGACFFWADPKQYPKIDQNRNGTFMRLDPQTYSVQITTVIDGLPQTSCSTMVHP